ncbi:MAG TPA: hypothetical protein VJN96_01285 [Vicinamibacterales bacterium]|nr:hypothetical protein [Vicinamibacterales bacterium]
MATTSDRLLLWSPRILGLLVTVFIGMFALDAFSEGKPFLTALLGFVIHLLPALVLLGIVVASFRRPWIGAMGFIGLAVYYTLAMSRGRLDWILAIPGPMLVVGGLFLLSWWRRSRWQVQSV